MNLKQFSLTVFTGLALSVSSFAAPTKLAVDTAASKLEWKGTKLVGSSHNGTIPLKSGELVVEGKDLKGGEFTVDMTGIKNDDITDADTNGKLVGHLKNEDFFAVDKHPTATFKIGTVTALKAPKDGNTHEITGDLTIRGKTSKITFPAKVDVQDKKASATATILVDRTKFDVKYNSSNFFKGLGDKVINNDFEMKVSLATK